MAAQEPRVDRDKGRSERRRRVLIVAGRAEPAEESIAVSAKLALVPMTIGEAKAFVDQHHRHRAAPVSGLFAVAAATGETVVAVAIVGRLSSRILDDGWTVEITRLCALPDTPNACSMLYAACWRASRAVGYRKLVTYTLSTESGSSLRAAGLRCVAEVRAKSWHTPSRPRVDKNPLQEKFRWEITA